MALEILYVLYIGIGLLFFIFGFMLVYKNLRKINLIEGEKFIAEDWISCTLFGLMFSTSFVFIINLTFDILLEAQNPVSISGYLLIVLIVILIFYPLWEITYLGRPTSDSVHEIHKFLETKILDRFSGIKVYIGTLLLYLVIYILPIFIISAITAKGLGSVVIFWFLIFPLFFLNYFAASGQMSTILQTTYRRSHYIIKKQENVLLKKKSKIGFIMPLILIVIAWVPFILSIYNFGGAISGIFDPNIEERQGYMALLSLFTTVVFGIMGFFKKFWNKKSKTKTIDFIFSGYIFIGIGVNMLINFYAINPAVVSQVLSVEILGFSLNNIGAGEIFSDPFSINLLILVQSGIILFYGVYLLFNKVSEFQADTKLSSLNKAYRLLEVSKLLKIKKGKIKLRKNRKEKKPDLPTLFKSVLLSPLFDKHGLDINEPVRKKAARYLLLICTENRDNAELVHSIIDKVVENTIELPEEKQGLFISKDAIDLLGNIGKLSEYASNITSRLIDAIPKVNIQVKQYILDALGDVGESKENLKQVLEHLKPLLIERDYALRRAACLAIVEMVLEGSNDDPEFIKMALNPLYEILESHTEDEVIIETTLETLLSCCGKAADDIDIQKVLPFLNYNVHGGDKVIIGSIIRTTISIVAYMVYYNLESFPVNDIKKYLDDDRGYIRYVAVDAIGNYLIEKVDKELLRVLMEMSIKDEDLDVTEMCAESIAEVLIINKGLKISIEGQDISVLDFYLKALESSNRIEAENATEALKSIAPLYEEENIWPILSKQIQGDNLELVRDCLCITGSIDKFIHDKIDVNIILEKIKHPNATVRAEAVHALGLMSDNHPEINPNELFSLLDDEDPTVRQQTIFALGNLGEEKPSEIVPILIERFLKMILLPNVEENVTEEELIAESLGIIGKIHPMNEIIVTLQRALMGDMNEFAKDVVAKALYSIGVGLIKTGKAKKTIDDADLVNVDYSIRKILLGAKKEYTIGNLIIILIEALQQKGIPEIVMNEISDSMQDLLPAFTFKKNEKKPNEVLNAIKSLLAQAYYSNYDSEILETIDRCDSLINFRASFDAPEENKALRKRLKFYSSQFTNDGKQFHDQGEIFLMLAQNDPEYLDYALKSFKMAAELAANEYYTPNCLYQMAVIYKMKNNIPKAKEMFQTALEIFASLDEVGMMKICKENLAQLN
ncbi:MAG: HEAT repeat domain-containing protein [Candidatus Lokiarchaeota archaeon]|nr:HEAT repeat domain-containing protein [Candidatus Lokiarchaeota archaeon]